MKDLILKIVRAMVDYPDRVSVSEVNGDQMTVFELNVAREDLGKVIGKQGQNAKAIRTILNAASARERRRSVLEIIDQKENIQKALNPKEDTHETQPNR